MSPKSPQQSNSAERGGQFLVYEAEDGKVKIDVRLEEETVWLPQAQLAELFQTSQQNISLHIRHVYEEGELLPEATHKKYLLVRAEGGREVKRLVDHYNLDMIISVGYRVKSNVATRFRIWATQHIKSRDAVSSAPTSRSFTHVRDKRLLTKPLDRAMPSRYRTCSRPAGLKILSALTCRTAP